MIIENHVEHWANGKLNELSSYIVVQDQHAGLFADEDEAGNLILQAILSTGQVIQLAEVVK